MKKALLLILIFGTNLIISQNISISANSNSINEGESFVLTGTLDQTSELDTKISLTISGTATYDSDYSFTFDSKGAESALSAISSNYNHYDILSDGRSVFLESNNLKVYDPSTQETADLSLSRSYEYLQVSGNTIYTKGYSNGLYAIYSIDLTDLSSISEVEEIVLSDGLNFEYEFSVEGDNILYNIYDNNNSTYKIYIREGSAEPELLASHNEWGLSSVLVDNKPYMIQYYDTVYEVVGGALVQKPELLTSEGGRLQVDENWINVFEDKVYVRTLIQDSTDGYQIYEVDFETGLSTILNYNLGSDIDVVKDFSFDTYGNLVLFSSTTESSYTLRSYQIAPEIKILAGATTGTITFTGSTDTLDESDETIIVTPGDVSNGTLSDSSAITATIVDINDPSVVTFAFTSDSVTEGSAAVTLTATAELVSELDITIPFTIAESSTASADGYTVSATEIVITAGSTTGSVTVTAVDDDAVEVLETIVFTIGELVNGSTETTELSLNLDSDDDSTVTSIAFAPTSFDEDASTVLTATIDAPSSRDLSFPLTLSGTSTADIDFTSTFASQGQETLVYSDSSDNFHILSDGRYLLINGSVLNIYNPETEVTVTKSMQRAYNYTRVSETENTFYGVSDSQLWKINLSTDDTLTESVYIDAPGYSFEYGFSMEGDKFFYRLGASNSYLDYTKTGDAAPVLVMESNDCCWSPVLINDRLILMRENFWREIVNGEMTQTYYQTLDGNEGGFSIEYYNERTIRTYNGQVYVSAGVAGLGNRIYKFDVANNNLVSLNYTQNAGVLTNNPRWFAFDAAENLLINAFNNDNSTNVYSYQLAPEMKILAGATTGTITFTGSVDTFDEADETIIVTPGAVSNGILTDSSAITATIVDINDPSVVTFTFTSDTVTEGSAAVTLTATAELVSGQDITIPFTIAESSTASSDEYTVSATEIVITAGEATGSVTITAVDDAAIEVLETIVFTIGELVNGSTEATELSLNLESDDDSTVTSIVFEPTSFDEDASTVLTATIDAASSRDLSFPITLSGTATAVDDYTTAFASQGEETLKMIIDENNNSYSNFSYYEGKYIFVGESDLRVFDPVAQTTNQYNFQNYIGGSKKVISGDYLYYYYDNSIKKIDISDFTSISTSEPTEIISTTSPIGIGGGFNVIDGTIYYQTYQNITGTWRVYSLVEGEDPVQIHVNQQFDGFFKINNTLYSFGNGTEINEYSNGEFNTQNPIYSNINIYYNSFLVNNGKLYLRGLQSSPYNIYEANFNASNVEYTQLNYSLASNTNTIQGFDFDSATGELLLYNQSTEGIYSVFSYQLSTEMKILAGATTGTLTFTGYVDTLDEADETIIVTPGAVSNGTLSDSSAIQATIVDINDPSAVTFAFTSDSVTEGSAAVTLTASVGLVSDLDITIPFTIAESSTASADEYTVSATEIVITAGSTTGSVTVTAVDDDAVEVLETIVFTIGELVNGSTETTELSLNLDSDDDSTVTSIAFAPTSFDEDASTVLTATIDAPSSRDLSFPVTFSGTATEDEDYTATYLSQGQETLVYSNSPSEEFNILSDGRYLFVNGNTLYIYNPETEVTVNKSMERDYDYIRVSETENTFYGLNGSQLWKINLSTDDSVTESVHIDAPGYSFEYGFGMEGDKFFYRLYASSLYSYYTKTGDAEPVLIAQENDCCWAPVLINDRLILMRGNYWKEIINGEINDQNTYYQTLDGASENFSIEYYNERSIRTYNNEVYVNASVPGVGYKIFRFDIANNNLVSLNYTQNANVLTNNGRWFSVLSSGNLIVNEIFSEDGTKNVYSYQLAPEIKILAGATTGTVTFTGSTDILDESDETIIVTPGDVSNGTLSDSSAITATIVDINDPSVVTFAFSSDTVTEGSAAVTLTATAELVSDLDITIPFTIAESSTASNDDYTVSATEIVITAGSTTGSVTVTAVDDDAVEVLETIVFTIGELVNGSTETTELSLNLESDDDPNSALSATNPEMNEGESTTITLTLDTPTSDDVIVPLIMSGTATFDIDYSTDFETEGDETLLMPLNQNYTQGLEVLEDGRYITLWYNNLDIWDPVNQINIQVSFDDAFNEFQIEGEYVYLKSNQKISRFPISDLDSPDEAGGYTINLTEIVGSDLLGSNDYYEGSFSVEGETLLYQIYDSPFGRKVFKKEGTNDPELLYQGQEYAQKLLLFNGRAYRFDSSNIRELYQGEYGNSVSYDNINIYQIYVFNGQVYALIDNYDNEEFQREIVKINLENDIINSVGSTSEVVLMPYQLSDDIDSIVYFTFDSLGNLTLLNDVDNEYILYNYQLFPEILISSGETTGSFTFQSIEDNSFEADETIIVTPGEALNTVISSEPVTLSIIDDDNPPLITFELSSESIIENSEYSVTLTATSDIASGTEITVPFALSGTALPDEYEVSSTSIVIPPNATSGSVTISTFGYDDNEVELAETIIFTFGEITNATTETESISLTLLSEDDATIDSVVIEQTELNEGESTTLTVSINTPSSSDIYLPLVFGGTASAELDYTTEFIAQGEESLVGEISNSEFQRYGVLADGRHVFLNQNTLRVMSADTESENTASLNGSYYFMEIEGNTIYIANNEQIATVDLTDISSGLVELEQIVSLDGFYMNGYSFSVEDGKVLYGVGVDGSDVRQVWLFEDIENDPILIYSGNTCCYKPVLSNGNVYGLESWQYTTIIDGVRSDAISYNGSTGGINRDKKIIVRNGMLYGLSYDGDAPIVKVDLEALTGVTTALDIDISDDINNTRSFDFGPNGNVLLFNELIVENQLVSQINSYLTGAELKVDAGETSGSITINTIDDDSYETTESITIGFGTPTNAVIGNIEGSEITILDNDESPTVDFELSSDYIVENSTEDVNLTATLSVISGYETVIPFTMSGTAGSDEYVVSALSITIPAGSISGIASVSTDGLDDTQVEMLETIVFNIGELTNASTEVTEVTLQLESDDDPNLVSIIAEPLEFAEHESSLVTATIDEASSRDVYIPLTISGTATSEIDYSYTFESFGEEEDLEIEQSATTNYSNFNVLSDNRIIGLDGWNVYIHELNGETTVINLGNYYDDIIVYEDQVYLRAYQMISKLDLTTNTETVIRELSLNDAFHHITVVNGKLFSMIINGGNGMRTFDYMIEGQDPVILGSFDGYPGDGLGSFAVNSQEEVFTSNGDNLWKVTDAEDLVNVGYIESFNVNSPYGLNFYNDILYITGYSYSLNSTIIGTFEQVTYPEMGDQIYFSVNPIEYLTTIFADNSQQFQHYAFDSSGKLLVLYYNNSTGSRNIKSYKNSPEIKISSGNLTGTIQFNGIEDDLNAPGEETDETIIIDILSPVNAIADESAPFEDITLTILNNEISLTSDDAALVNVPSMSETSIAWGDYDRDGDQDMAIMGVSFFDGVVTRLYENDNGVFVLNDPGLFSPTFSGDLMWVDYNKDGFIDLVVSGLDPNNEPSTVIYQNIDGFTFTPSTDLTMPNLFQTSMASGDLDSDGDIDFVINGIDANNEWKKYIYMREGSQLVIEEDFQNQFNGDFGVENGIVGIADNNIDGDLDIFMVSPGGSFVKMNTFITEDTSWQNAGLPNLDHASMEFFGNSLYMMGDQENEKRFYRRDLLSGQDIYLQNVEGLIYGDIAIGDYNNDGFEDLVITGENSEAEPISKIYNGTAGGFLENTEIELIGLRNSTAKWVDYDSDGDLDLFLSGTGNDGEVTQIYKTDLLNKSNEPADIISSLSFEGLGNGKVRLSWDAPEDDFSQNLGYVLRLGTTPSGTELSNTESNLETGQRLITKSPQINTNNVEILLDPGEYYWSVQSVDGGLMGSEFSIEQSFTLVYEWKLLNQGGIIDRSIQSIPDPIVKLTDIDGDNDMDLVYGSKTGNSDIQVFRLGDRNFEYFDNVNGSNNISDIEFLDINDDLILDMIVNSWDNSNNNSLKLYNSTSEGGFNNVFTAPGLFQAKIELIDINNDGTQEIIHAGRSSELANSQLQIFVYEQVGSTLSESSIDISDQVSGLKQGAFGFGNIDQDEDIDFAITGLSNFGAQSNVYLNETVFTETVAPIFELTEIDFPSVYESTLDFMDFDSDGDLDMVLTGTGSAGPIFKVLSNNGQTGDLLDFVEQPSTQLTPIRNANIDFGDYNGDGYTDILYNGTVTGQGEVTKLVEYNPTTQSYDESDFDLSDIVSASIAFGDIDGDDDLDFTIAGESSANGNSIIKTYLNVRNESAEVIGLSAPAGRLMTSTLNSTSTSTDEFIVNEKPTTPEGLLSEEQSFDPLTGIHKVKFSWAASTDDHTESSGLSYALKVGTNSGGTQVMKVNALPNGYRLSAGRGNVEQRLEWQLNLPDGEYFWSVQAIDASFSGSLFSDEVIFETEIPVSCLTPTELVISDITGNSAILSWTAVGDETQWEYQVVESGVTPAETGTVSTDIPIVLTDLSFDTTYDVYLRANCADDDNSEWASITFTTTEAPPCLTPTNLIASDVTTTGATLSWDSDGTAFMVELQPSGSAQGTAGGYVIGDVENITTTSVTIPEGSLAPNTSYDFFVVNICGEGDLSEYAGPSTFTTLTPCLPVTDLTVSDITSFGALVSWVSEGSQFMIEIQAAGSPQGTEGGYTVGDIDPYPLTYVDLEGFLAPDFAYDIYVMNVCDSSNSAWAGPVSFTTSVLGPNCGETLSYFYPVGSSGGFNFDTNFTAANAADLLFTSTVDNAGDVLTLDIGGSTENGYDFVYVTDGAGNILLAPVSGTISESVESIDGTVNVYLASDISITNGPVTFTVSCAPLGVDDVETSQFSFFPNPVNDTLTIKAQASIDSITVYNMLGQAVVRSTPKTINCTVDMSKFDSGAYFVQVSINNTLKTVRVIKN